MSNSIVTETFRVQPGEKVDLGGRPTTVKPLFESKKDYHHISMQAYEAALGATSTADSPWYDVPADDKKNARLIISQIILDAFHEIPMAYPEATADGERN